MNKKDTEMNTAKVLEFKESSMSVDDIIALTKGIDTPRATGIRSIIEHMRSIGKTDDRIKQLLLAGSKIKI